MLEYIFSLYYIIVFYGAFHAVEPPILLYWNTGQPLNIAEQCWKEPAWPVELRCECTAHRVYNIEVQLTFHMCTLVDSFVAFLAPLPHTHRPGLYHTHVHAHTHTLTFEAGADEGWGEVVVVVHQADVPGGEADGQQGFHSVHWGAKQHKLISSNSLNRIL